MSSGDGLHTATTFLLATTTFTGTFLFDHVSEEMREKNVLRFAEQTSTRNSAFGSACSFAETYTVVLMGSLFFSSHEVAVYETVPA